MFGAIEAGGTKFVCAIGSADGHVVARAIVPTTTPEETFAGVAQLFAANQPLRSIGVAAFGPLDTNPNSSAYGSILQTPKPHWSGVSFAEALAAWDAPVCIDTDVNGAALGEWTAGAGQGLDTLAYVTVGTGIGVGVLNRGRPLGGFGHLELGHIHPPRAPGDAFEGSCPFHGDCLEGLACGPSIAARWGASLSELGTDHPAFACQAHYLAHLAVTITLAHTPERIVFGGGVMKTPGLLEEVRVRTARLLNRYLQAAEVGGELESYLVSPGLGEDAGIRGALLLASRAMAA